MPGQLRELSARIFDTEREKAARLMSEASAEIQQVLRASLAEMVGQANAATLGELIERWLECEDSQAAGNALTRVLFLQQTGEPVFPGPGIWPIPPA